MAFSRGTYGPGERRTGVLDHLRKELVEIEEANGSADEWVDAVILSIDGLTRRLAACSPAKAFDEIAEIAVRMIVGKQARNELRDWPDWRAADPDKAIEHVRRDWPPLLAYCWQCEAPLGQGGCPACKDASDRLREGS